ncbi:MAG: tetratricopeptide repeat protein [Candidatus Solibacter usitatus]|nr:tetratricopeptide repeat protein [Candidatus Solibacter usitatus]
MPGACLILLTLLSAAQPAAEALFERGQRQQRSGQLAAAEATYRQYLKEYGPRAEVLANLGALLAGQERYPPAIAAYRQALKLAPSLAPIHLNLGLAYFKSGQHDAALVEFDAFLKADPAHRQARQLRAVSLLELERPAEAAQAYLTLPPEDPSVQIGLATAYTRLGKSGEAQRILQALLARENSAEVHLLLSQAYLEENRKDEALASLQRASGLNPRLPSLRYYFGLAYWKQQHAEQALAEWRRELERDANYFPAIFALGGALATNPQAGEEALKYLRRARALRPRNAPALYQLAKLLWQRGKDPEAAPLLETAIASDPQYREAHYLLGTIYQALGRKSLAAREFAVVKRLTEEGAARSQDLFETAR